MDLFRNCCGFWAISVTTFGIVVMSNSFRPLVLHVRPNILVGDGRAFEYEYKEIMYLDPTGSVCSGTSGPKYILHRFLTCCIADLQHATKDTVFAVAPIEL